MARSDSFEIRIERRAERSLAVADEAGLHAKEDVAEAGDVRVRASRVIVGNYLDVRREVHFHVEILGHAESEIGVGIEIGVGNHAIAVLQRRIEDVGLDLKVAGIDGTGYPCLSSADRCRTAAGSSSGTD